MECSICMGEYNAADNRPMVLGCGHTFCYSCLADCFKSAPACPHCRRAVTAPLSEIPTNFELLLYLAQHPIPPHISVEERKKAESDLLANHNEINCKNGHPLHWDEAALEDYKSQGFSYIVCDICSKRLDRTCWHCRPCQYDLCDSCYTWLQNSAPSQDTAIQCYNGHSLRRTADLCHFYQGSFKCHSCLTPAPPGPVYHCRLCRTNMCEECCRALLAAIPHSASLHCNSSHSLVWHFETIQLYKSIYGASSYQCDFCSRVYEKIGSFHCKTCNFDLCPPCASALLP